MKILTALVLAASLHLYAGYVYSGELTPRECIHKIQNSINEADGTTFQELVDLDSIGKDAWDIFLKNAEIMENSNQLPPFLSLMMSKGTGTAVEDLILNEARAFILNGINSGAFAGKKLDYAQKKGLLAPLFANASLGRKSITAITEGRKDGKDWLIDFAIYDYDNGHIYPINARLDITGNSCRLKRIENMEQLFSQIQAEANQ